ncbi:MAG: RNA polymerase sigma factor [Candidatus Methylumidiphilus sp.]
MSLDITALYLAYRQELVNRLSRVVSCRETAQDIVQESFFVLARTAAAETVGQPRAFLHRTATHLAFDHLRHRKVVERHAEIAAHTEESEQPSTEAEVSKAQWLELLRQVVSELPPRCRDAFILHKIQGLSYREVGEALGISQSAVEKHIIKGLAHCRARLGADFKRPAGTR